MKISDITEEFSPEEARRAREWSSRKFNAVGPPNGPWTVENRLAIHDTTVAGPFDDKDEAWTIADQLQDAADQKEVDWYKAGNKGMWGGDVHMAEDKDTFVRKLQDPGLVDLENAVEQARQFGIKMNDGNDEYSFEIFERGETNFIRFSFDPYSDYFGAFSHNKNVIERKTFKIIGKIREVIEQSDHWVWDTWRADAAGVRTYVIAK